MRWRGQPRRLPPVKPAHPTKRNQLIAIGCGVALLLVLAIGGGSAVLWETLEGKNETTQSLEAKKMAAAQDVLADTLTLELHAGDPTVQWVRLSNAGGKRLLTARPDGTGQFAPDTYTLSVKVMARSVLEGDLELTEDTSLTCKPATMGQVRCTDANGNPRLLLRP